VEPDFVQVVGKVLPLAVQLPDPFAANVNDPAMELVQVPTTESLAAELLEVAC
jgi:hypothetical protein